MTLEERRANVLINKAGGTAGPEGRSYRVVLPPVWVKQLGITENSREVLLQFDGESITIRRAGTGEYVAFLNEAREKSTTCWCFTIMTVRSFAPESVRIGLPGGWPSKIRLPMCFQPRLVLIKIQTGRI